MSGFLILLCTPNGVEIGGPSDFDMRRALAELFQEDESNSPDAYNSKHQEAWLAYSHGSEASFYCITIERSGRALFSRWPSAMSDSPEYEHVVLKIAEADALNLWSQLAKQKTDWVREWFIAHA